jgi:hypothetical protein
MQARSMDSQNEPHHSGEDGITVSSIIAAAIPFFALTIGPIFANQVEPRILGLPFLLAYCVISVLLTPLFLILVDRLRKR